MVKKDYSKLEKDDLLKVIEKLESRKKYGLIWDEEKTKEQFEKESENALPVLKEVKGKEIKTDASKPTNILIEGDNYHALSVLNYTHQGKIDVIYIDPPYNTGKNDFKYNDKWIDENDTYRHSKWLSFMSKRLRISKSLLKTDGMIMISIDDHEMAQLKLLCDEIFGEENLLSVHHIQVRYPEKTLKNQVSDWHALMEYVLIYAKNSSQFITNKPSVPYDKSKFKFEIKELAPGKEVTINGKQAFVFERGEYTIKEAEPTEQCFKETWASGSVITSDASGAFCNSYIVPRKELGEIGCLYKVMGIGLAGDGLGYRYFTGVKSVGNRRGKFFTRIPLARKLEQNLFQEKPVNNLYDFAADFGNIAHEGGIPFNSGKKPITMISELINYHPNKNAVVLDFFAGSGSTAHAVLALNGEGDGDNRCFIICTNNEESICTDVCYPRVKNVIKGYKSNKSLGGNLKYYKTAFVKNSISRDDLKMRITRECTEMLCLREGIFDEVKAKPDYYIFEQNGRIMGVYYSMERGSLAQLKKELDKMEGEKILYCFTFDPLGLDKNDFADWQGVSLESIPQKILDIYEQIYEY